MLSVGRVFWSISAIALLAPVASARPKQPRGAVCVYRQEKYPADDGLPDPPMPRNKYFIQVDDRPRVEIRPDHGTLIADLSLSKEHVVSLYQRDKRIASSRERLLSSAPVCAGIQDGGLGIWKSWTREYCGCPEKR